MPGTVGAMLVLVNLDMFAHFLAAWHTKHRTPKLPASAHPNVPCYCSHGGWHGEFGTIILFVVVDGCKMLHNTVTLLTQWIILSKINFKVHILKTILNAYSTCQNTHTHGKKTDPQHILQTHRKHIQNVKGKQKHIFKRYIYFQFFICYTNTFPIYPP